jgi:hypothetical protein
MMDNDNDFSDDHLEYNREILKFLAEHIEKYPAQRFGQILFNLCISQFKDENNPSAANYAVRDIYNDLSKDILKRVEEQVEKMNR